MQKQVTIIQIRPYLAAKQRAQVSPSPLEESYDLCSSIKTAVMMKSIRNVRGDQKITSIRKAILEYKFLPYISYPHQKEEERYAILINLIFSYNILLYL